MNDPLSEAFDSGSVEAVTEINQLVRAGWRSFAFVGMVPVDVRLTQ